MKSRWKLLGAVEDCFVERSEKVSATQTSSWNTIYNFIYKFLHRAGLFSYSDCEWFSAPMMTQSRSKLKTCPSRMSWVSLMSMGSSDMIFPLKVKSPSKGLNTLFFSSVNAPACKQSNPTHNAWPWPWLQTNSVRTCLSTRMVRSRSSAFGASRARHKMVAGGPKFSRFALSTKFSRGLRYNKKNHIHDGSD